MPPPLLRGFKLLQDISGPWIPPLGPEEDQAAAGVASSSTTYHPHPQSMRNPPCSWEKPGGGMPSSGTRNVGPNSYTGHKDDSGTTYRQKNAGYVPC